MSDEHDPQDRLHEDPFCGLLGIEFSTIDADYAETTLTVSEEHLNFNGRLHGGVVFALADAAAAAAAETDTAGESTVGLETSTSFLSSVEAGETIIARAESIHETSKTTKTRVVVSTADDERVATFTARGFKI